MELPKTSVFFRRAYKSVKMGLYYAEFTNAFGIIDFEAGKHGLGFKNEIEARCIKIEIAIVCSYQILKQLYTV